MFLSDNRGTRSCTLVPLATWKLSRDPPTPPTPPARLSLLMSFVIGVGAKTVAFLWGFSPCCHSRSWLPWASFLASNVFYFVPSLSDVPLPATCLLSHSSTSCPTRRAVHWLALRPVISFSVISSTCLSESPRLVLPSGCSRSCMLNAGLLWYDAIHSYQYLV